jgi:hypothetical protein
MVAAVLVQRPGDGPSAGLMAWWLPIDLWIAGYLATTGPLRVGWPGGCRLTSGLRVIWQLPGRSGSDGLLVAD